MINENVKVTGKLLVQLFDENGLLKEKREINNLVVTAGKNFIASRMTGAASAVMSHMAVGTGTIAPAAANTTLGAEIAGSRVALTTATTAANVVSYATTFNPGVGTGAVTEAGIFNDASAGTMLARTTFAVVNKGAADTLTINWTVTVN